MSGWRGWIGTLAAGAVLAELAEALAPENWRERIGKIAALAVLASLVLSFGSFAGAGESIAERARELFAPKEAEEATSGREAWSGTAKLIFSYVRELGLDADGMTVTVTVPEEEGEKVGIQLSLPRCPYAEWVRIEEELGAALGAAVRVETGDG